MRPPTGHVLHGRCISAVLRGERPHGFTRVNSLERGRRERRTAIESRCEVHGPSRGRDDPETERGGRHGARRSAVWLGKSASKSGCHQREKRARRRGIIVGPIDEGSCRAGGSSYRLGKTTILELNLARSLRRILDSDWPTPKTTNEIRLQDTGCCFGLNKSCRRRPLDAIPAHFKPPYNLYKGQDGVHRYSAARRRVRDPRDNLSARLSRASVDVFVIGFWVTRAEG